jgi:dynamin GTPase
MSSAAAMEAIDELVQLSESMRQAASLLADDDPSDETASRRPSTFLNAVALGNVVSAHRPPRELEPTRRPRLPI